MPRVVRRLLIDPWQTINCEPETVLRISRGRIRISWLRPVRASQFRKCGCLGNSLRWRNDAALEWLGNPGCLVASTNLKTRGQRLLTRSGILLEGLGTRAVRGSPAGGFRPMVLLSRANHHTALCRLCLFLEIAMWLRQPSSSSNLPACG